MTEEDKRIARNLQLALAEGFACRIDDPEAMKFAKGLRDGVTEGRMGLETVPIGVAYSAMFAFVRLQSQGAK